ncbi:MAG: phosphate acetyltransferase [Deltaproteobacteria bacterium RIFCSPHIGHO2_12_FULL_43_9]|nr:MAG: phosphate acetyltransferase [Deltaproteobacteria bacterium RIFCSPHIGHO2_12_FULL_43_9]
MISKKEALDYHTSGRPGKIEVVPTKPCSTQHDLSLAYTPGVAEACKEISRDPDTVYKYTAKGNLVAVISNGTAVLGLGNMGGLASKPVMEGKGILFKRFADIDVFDIELNTTDPDETVKAVQALEPTFGGINLEDIKAPDCFYIEEKLRQTMKIPVFHDDQHGTAIITSAALLNALELAGKKIDQVKIVFSGAGAAATACGRLFENLGARKGNIIYCDHHGVIFVGRTVGMNPYKEALAAKTKAKTLTEALDEADVFVGLSAGGIVSKEMIKKMGKKPIIFAMANPEPEISYPDAKEARPDAIVATGRSDFPNQVNNVLCFPFIFRGALDVRAKAFTNEMFIAAVHAIATLAKEDVPDSVRRAYPGELVDRFGPDYIIPKPFDFRTLLWVAPAVAQAAMDSGVARVEIKDMNKYRESLEKILGRSRVVMREIINKAKFGGKKLIRIVFPEGEQEKILKAAEILSEEKIAIPVLIGNVDLIKAKIKELQLNLDNVEIIKQSSYPKFGSYVDEFFKLRRRKGITSEEADKLMRNPNYFGSMMVRMGDAEGLVSGLTCSYPETIRPALHVIRTAGEGVVAGLYMIILKERIFFFADTTVNIEPTPMQLAMIGIRTADKAKSFMMTPKVAFLSYSNFGSTKNNETEKVAEAVRIAKELRPDLLIDGEMQADTAVIPEIVTEQFPFCKIKGDANVLIFPDLDSSNICYKLMQRIGGAEAVGPILIGMAKPVHVLQRFSDVNDIVNMAAITVIDYWEMQAKQARG